MKSLAPIKTPASFAEHDRESISTFESDRTLKPIFLKSNHQKGEFIMPKDVLPDLFADILKAYHSASLKGGAL